jgi:hypothetical protein
MKPSHSSSISFLIIAFVLPYATASACEAPVGRFCVDYYRGIRLSGAPVASTQMLNVNFDWGRGTPSPRVPVNYFSARWQGYFEFNEGSYEFRLRADDGARIFIDGRPVLDRWTNAAGQEHTAMLKPGAGKRLVTIEYYESTGTAGIRADWRPVVQITARASDRTRTNTAGRATVPETKPAFPLGINLSGFNYWSSAVPFKDLVMQSGLVGMYKRTSDDACEVQPPMNKEGYPAFIPKGCRFRLWSVFHIKNEYWPEGVPPYRPGRYVLLHKGEGTIKLGWDASNTRNLGAGRMEFDVPTPNSGIQVEILESNPNNPIHDLHIVDVNDEATFKTQPFNEAWLNILKPFSVLRFQDWGQVSLNIPKFDGRAVSATRNTITLPASAPDTDGLFNGMVAMVNVNGKYPRVFVDRYDGASRTLYLRSPIELSANQSQPSLTLFDFANKTWAERTQPVTLGQGGNAGVAFEYMIDLANTLNANPWINVPTAADDRFVEELAKLIKSRLKPALKVYIEYSNETWNYDWPGYHYSEAKVNDIKLTGTWIPADAWQAYRAVEIFKIFNRVFGEPDLREQRRNSRLVRILTSQTAWFDRAVKVMDWTASNNAWPTQGTPAHKFADAWAITTYFAAPNGAKPVELASQAELVDMQKADIDEDSAKQPAPGIHRQIIEACRARGLKVVSYEGGTHLLAPQERTNLVTKMVLTNRDPRMENVYNHALNKWGEFAKEYGTDTIGAWNQYYDVGRYSKYGYWGLLESTYQAKANAPKYKAFETPSLK